MKAISNAFTWLLSLFIKLYRYGISPLIGPRCRFYPTCSEYALDALKEHGPIKGTWLTGKRLAKCHPFHPGGIDLVPSSQPQQTPEKLCKTHLESS